MLKPMIKLAAAAGLTLAAVAVPTAASAATNAPIGCPPDEFTDVSEVGSVTHESIADTAGKFNASSAHSVLRYDMSTTRERSTTWMMGGGAGLDFGIFSIEAQTKYDVTNKVTTGRLVSNTLDVPARRYGYVRPTVEYRLFHITEMRRTARCGVEVIKDYGTMKAITAVPFFQECVAKSPCTPKD